MSGVVNFTVVNLLLFGGRAISRAYLYFKFSLPTDFCGVKFESNSNPFRRF
ncbi:hypothetical protein CSUNSWCD_1858 [Campylobacter showae CSUNSWCD]|uniref:Uncharacterized protein n=1 Tax=Campylobacter showae CSUNSWCD TaxID=1244083 RepID=M5IFN8_9BACT|nr:hypothetical protein CSUNSWCD_1858 [Campylobacter showae CSUNSWCD]